MQFSASHLSTAFKEWAVICEALASGGQTLILRKGGIHEGQAGFRVAQRQFWLLPTRFHASPTALTPAAAPLFPRAERWNPDNNFRVSLFADVSEVLELQSESDAQALSGLHLWSETTIRERFQYKRPGLFALIVRIYRSPDEVEIADTPAIAGCRSWVELPDPLPVQGLVPILNEADFARQTAEIKARLP